MSVVETDRSHFFRHQNSDRNRQLRSGLKAHWRFVIARQFRPPRRASRLPNRMPRVQRRHIQPAPRPLPAPLQPQYPYRSRSTGRSSVRAASGACFPCRGRQLGISPRLSRPCLPMLREPCCIRQSPLPACFRFLRLLQRPNTARRHAASTRKTIQGQSESPRPLRPCEHAAVRRATVLRRASSSAVLAADSAQSSIHCATSIGEYLGFAAPPISSATCSSIVAELVADQSGAYCVPKHRGSGVSLYGEGSPERTIGMFVYISGQNE